MSINSSNIELNLIRLKDHKIILIKIVSFFGLFLDQLRQQLKTKIFPFSLNIFLINTRID